MRRLVLTVAAYAVTAVLAWLVISSLWLWRNQERVVYQPPAVVPPDPNGATRVVLRAADGRPGFAFVVMPSNGAPTATLVAFHGNADLAAWLVPWAQDVARRANAIVVVPEYRGYGGIPGTASYEGIAADAAGALAYARTLPPRRLVLYGHSLGTAIAVELADAARDQPLDALVLQSPFTSAREMAARMLVPAVPWLWSRMARVRYDTRKRVRELDVPVSVAHGTMDLTIPTRMGRDVYAAARRPGELLLVAGAGHNDVAEAGGEAYWRWLAAAVSGTSAPVRELEQQRGGRLP